MMPEPVSKSDQIRAKWRDGDKLGALHIAARFWDRSPETQVFKRAWDAHSNPSFYRQLGRDPEALTQAGFDALAKKLGLRQ
jgi:hypothetical protein